MAGGVADAQEDRPAELRGSLEGLVAPGIPVDGVVGVLPEVGAGLEDQPVGVARRAVVEQVASSGNVGLSLSRECLVNPASQLPVERFGTGQPALRSGRGRRGEPHPDKQRTPTFHAPLPGSHQPNVRTSRNSLVV